MKVLDLRCTSGHQFEAWFGSEADFQSQRERGLVACPFCADTAVEKMLSAPRLNLGNHRPEDGHAAQNLVPPADPENQLRVAWLALSRQLLANTEDVGKRFAQEARMMHYGERSERPIRGQTTLQEAIALSEEGIPVVPIPYPDLVNQTLH